MHRVFARSAIATALVLCATCACATAQSQPQVQPQPLPAPRDVAYPGTIQIEVDATDTAQGIFRVHETIPVQAGPLVLLLPKWIPGNHSPSGPIADLAGLSLSADGKPLAWTRNNYDVYAFHVDVPQDTTRIDARFQYLSARHGGFEMTDRMLMLEWNNLSLYPAGYFTRGIHVEPSVTLPQGWQFGTALETATQQGNTTRFKPVAYDTLVDSPIYAGQHFKRVDLAPGAKVPVHLDLFADAPRYLDITPAQLQAHRALVTQANTLFASHHYDHYDFLLSLSDQLAGNGLEHHQSSENGLDPDYFTAWDDNAPERDLLAHEYTHSWNGKFRRPADLWTPDFNTPMGDSLLWVYEGQTQYWGYVLSARAGIWTQAQFLDAMAMVAAKYDRNRPGFAWRTLEDTTNDATAAHRQALPWRSWQMSEEYYSGGQMLWLAIDARLRALTHGRKSLDDFAAAFFGVDNGSFVTRTYTFDDVVAALQAIAPSDWAAYLKRRVAANNPPLLEGLEASGWKLVYGDSETPFEKQVQSRPQSSRHMVNFNYSIGLTLTKQGEVNDVLWQGPAFKAGVSTGATVVAVNGHEYSADVLKDAIRAAHGGTAPILLLVKYQGEYRTLPVDYHGGLQYPRLERIAGKPDYLSLIAAPRK